MSYSNPTENIFTYIYFYFSELVPAIPETQHAVLYRRLLEPLNQTYCDSIISRTANNILYVELFCAAGSYVICKESQGRDCKQHPLLPISQQRGNYWKHTCPYWPGLELDN